MVFLNINDNLPVSGLLFLGNGYNIVISYDEI